MGFLEERDLSDAPSIPEYYKGKNIFISGGSGFIGKVLIEKLLYSCSDLDSIYLLMREKKGVKSENRLEQIYSTACFDRLRAEKPDIFSKKVFVVTGDVCEPGLEQRLRKTGSVRLLQLFSLSGLVVQSLYVHFGLRSKHQSLSNEDRALLVDRVNIIFHVAASVRFDDPLTYAAQLNLKGTKDMIDLANDMRNLSSFVHVSTSYSNTNHDPVAETMYPPHADWRETLHVCNELDEHTLRVLTPKYLGELPNTYTFTKQLAEHVVYEKRGQLPAVIIRPSIVIASIEEPVPGWVENFNGPVGIFVACGKGIMRSIHTRPDIACDYIPVDICVRHIIAAGWIRGIKKLEQNDEIPIYNCCSGQLNKVVMEDVIRLSKAVGDNVALNGALWTVGGHVTTNGTVHYIKVLIQHLLPALLVDMILWILGKKTMLVKIQRRIYIANLALHYYLSQHWTFDNKNFVALRSSLKSEDIDSFYYEVEGVDLIDYFTICCRAGRVYLLKEKEEDLPSARAHAMRLKILEKTIQVVFFGCLVWWACSFVVQTYGDVLYDAFLL